jgi:ADP-ribose pyrophosphatase YjhB (NUDIX family)
MTDLGVNVAIIHSDRILLTQREDFEIWCLPGGMVDAGESVASAAIREALEETGLVVRLTRLVSIYSLPGWWSGTGSHQVLFAAEAITGTPQPQSGEVLEVDYFGLHDLPEPLTWWHHQRIRDALAGTCGAVWTQEVAWSFEPGLSRARIYQLRDQSGLSRSEFYLRSFGPHRPDHEKLDVRGVR